jgi:hypothetical protein
MMNAIPYVGAWMLLAIVVLGLALYRKFVSNDADNYVHMSEGEARLLPHQVAVNQKIDKIDRWGEILIVVTLVRECLANRDLVAAVAYAVMLVVLSVMPGSYVLKTD